MGSVRDIARLGKDVGRTDSSDIPGIFIYLGIFAAIILFFILFNAFIKYKIKQRQKK
jgi:hypothetical protein